LFANLALRDRRVAAVKDHREYYDKEEGGNEEERASSGCLNIEIRQHSMRVVSTVL
tara:strand:- start:293 stop:460 length:168 start_codon:yes stop_codon:yes gene_type:complete